MFTRCPSSQIEVNYRRDLAFFVEWRAALPIRARHRSVADTRVKGPARFKCQRQRIERADRYKNQ